MWLRTRHTHLNQAPITQVVANALRFPDGEVAWVMDTIVEDDTQHLKRAVGLGKAAPRISAAIARVEADLGQGLCRFPGPFQSAGGDRPSR